MEFVRNEFAGTRWAKTSTDSYVIKVNRGELEGATVWFRMKGDVGPVGRSDLVFVRPTRLQTARAQSDAVGRAV